MEVSPETATKEEGIRLLKAGQVDEAIKVFEKILKTDEDDPQVHMCLGVAYNQKNDRMRAIHHLESSINLKETAKGYYNLGLVYEAAHRIDEAVRQYKMAVEMDPAYTHAAEALEKLHNQYAAQHPEATAPAAAAQPAASAAAVTATPLGGAPAPQQNQTVMDPNRITVPPSGPPNWTDIQAKRDSDIKEAHRQSIVKGMLYGAICGAILFAIFGVLGGFVLGMFSATVGIVFFAVMIGQGLIFGGLIGLWMGYTCGDENQGALAGAVISVVLGLIGTILSYDGSSAGSIFWGIAIDAVRGAIGGYIIGRLVESSTQQV